MSTGSIGTLMDGVERRGLRLDLADSEVRLVGDRGLLDADQRAELDRRWPEVEVLVRLALAPRQPETPATQAEQLALGEAA